MIESGGEYDFRKRYFPVEQLLDDPESVEARHLDVKKYQIGVMLANEVNRFDAILSLGDDVDVADILQ